MLKGIIKFLIYVFIMMPSLASCSLHSRVEGKVILTGCYLLREEYVNDVQVDPLLDINQTRIVTNSDFTFSATFVTLSGESEHYEISYSLFLLPSGKDAYGTYVFDSESYDIRLVNSSVIYFVVPKRFMNFNSLEIRELKFQKWNC